MSRDRLAVLRWLLDLILAASSSPSDEAPLEADLVADAGIELAFRGKRYVVRVYEVGA